MNEFLDAKLDENYIETAYFMTNIRKIGEIIKNIDDELVIIQKALNSGQDLASQ